MQLQEDGAARAAQVLIGELFLYGPLPLVSPTYLEAAIGGQQPPQTHLLRLLSYSSPSPECCSTCLKTHNRFPHRIPWSSSSLQPLLSNSSTSIGYAMMSSSPSGKLNGCQVSSCWVLDLFPGPDSEPQPYMPRVH